MKNNRGYTLLEILIAISMTVILAALLTPLGTAYTKSHQREKEINEIDLELSKVVESIKRGVRSAKKGSGENEQAILPDNNDSNTYNYLRIRIDSVEASDVEYIWYVYDSNEQQLRTKQEDSASLKVEDITGGTVLMTNVQSVEFRYKDHIVTIYIKLSKGNYTREIRDAAVTRIDYKL